jgi:hypothetical protein
MTGDGLPLYTLTPRGRAEVATWLVEPDARAGWTDFVGHVLLVASLPDAPVGALIDAYRRVHASPTPPSDSLDGPLDELGLRSGEILSSAATAWLDEVQDVLARVDCSRPHGSFRPRRGRRPRREDV